MFGFIMNYFYKINSNTVTIDDILYTTYGISYYENNIVIETLFDISLNRNKVEKICDFLNKYQISHVHFKDIVEDFLE